MVETVQITTIRTNIEETNMTLWMMLFINQMIAIWLSNHEWKKLNNYCCDSPKTFIRLYHGYLHKTVYYINILVIRI